METLDTQSNRPPDLPPVSPDELRQWEAGIISLSPEQLVGALALQRELHSTQVAYEEQPLELLSAV